MALNRIKTAGLILVLLTTGCTEKDDLTLPVQVNLKMGIKEDSQAGNQYIDITGCRIAIYKIRFDGTREAGGSVFFETDPSANLQPLDFSENPATVSTFDLPQGIYDGMRWDISLKCLDDIGIDDGRHDGYPCLGILLSGNYTYLDGSVVPFVLAIDKPEQFRVTASNPDGYSTIVLSVGTVYDAIVYFSAYETFRSINRLLLEEAIVSGTTEEPIMIISSVQNGEMYKVLLFRLLLSTNIIVK